MVPLRAFRKTMTILAAALGCAIVASMLPENPYQRWQLLDGTIQARARWIYERCRFDPTPIDVVFLGPSRMEAGVDAPRLAEALKARGLPANVVNFSLPEAGRNINFAVAKELFAHKQPKLVILGVTEKPSRFGHPAFKYVADRASIADPGFIGDFDYFSDLVYLPFREMRLFAANLLPGGAGLAKEFDAANYRGPSVDTTGSVVLPDGKIKEGELPASAAELTRGVKKLEGGMHPPILPTKFADLEFGDERFYIRQIVDLAKEHGAQVAFLFLPFYTGPDDIQEIQFYRQFGPVINASFIATHADWFADYGHLTRGGAHILTDWLVDPVAALLKPEG
jgi:hypothetical protein